MTLKPDTLLSKMATDVECKKAADPSIDLLRFIPKSPLYRVILSALDPRKCEYLKDYSLDFEHAYMTTYLAT
jgi:hypothetical protein